MEVNRRIAGSHCVVFVNRDYYIDARSGSAGCTRIELVHSGHVKALYVVSNDNAPETIIALLKGKRHDHP